MAEWPGVPAAGLIVVVMAEWWSIEVFHGEFAASRWQDSHSSALIESAVSNGAAEWAWSQRHYGVAVDLREPAGERVPHLSRAFADGAETYLCPTG
jgi:hypothetical protein